ncbi:hypothetical protein B0H14DRAFT_856041 [Mycena olivaceomarginata]|nr:hypothetical protein B0H14DRAFT_856041 [Mycena olivaceomarginata]
MVVDDGFPECLPHNLRSHPASCPASLSGNLARTASGGAPRGAGGGVRGPALDGALDNVAGGDVAELLCARSCRHFALSSSHCALSCCHLSNHSIGDKAVIFSSSLHGCGSSPSFSSPSGCSTVFSVRQGSEEEESSDIARKMWGRFWWRPTVDTSVLITPTITFHIFTSATPPRYLLICRSQASRPLQKTICERIRGFSCLLIAGLFVFEALSAQCLRVQEPDDYRGRQRHGSGR